MQLKLSKFNFSIYKTLFYSSLIINYISGIVLYDSTTGLDWEKYSNTVFYFLGYSTNIIDPQGALYFSIISKLIILFNTGEQLLVSDVVQSFNFLLFIFGIYGIKKLLYKNYFESKIIYLSLTVLCYFPPVWYLRLTMKPEIFAFSLFPWIIYFLDLYFEKRKINFLIASITSISLVLTLKASIAGMVIFCLLIAYSKEILNLKNNFKILVGVVSTTLILIFENYKNLGLWIFEKRMSIEQFGETITFYEWDNRANIQFFTNIDIKNLLENPFKYLHSDSFFSITALDTLSDYFGFFWNHQENNNLISFNRVQFTENFLIQSFLPMYLSIIFSITFYFVIFLFIISKDKNWKLLSFPFLGMLILIINSLGFPSNNFNPQTGDTFKVHYYSFLVSFSFVYLVALFGRLFKKYKFVIFLLIPFFLISMGFPKSTNDNYYEKIEERFSISYSCGLQKNDSNICKNESDYFQNNSIFPEYQIIPQRKSLVFNYLSLIIFLLNLFPKNTTRFKLKLNY